MIKMIGRKAVNSSCVISMGYSPVERVLDIEFPAGAVYRYFDVPDHTYADLRDAVSKGAHFNRFIKHSFMFVRMTEDPKK